MTLGNIALRYLGRHKFRTVLTILGVSVAVLTFVLLRTITSSWMRGAEYAAKDRVATRHKVTFLTPLPKSYVDAVGNLEAVDQVTWCTWFGGRLAAKKDAFFNTIATDPTSFLKVYDELKLSASAREAWLSNRQSAIVGATTAQKFGWKEGDRVSLEGSIFPGTWEFVIAGIYSAERKSLDQSSFYFHWNYLNEALDAGDQARDQVGWIVSKVSGPQASAQVSKRIDAVFDVRDIQTLSMSERALNASFLGMLASLLSAVDVVSIVILLIMMLILGNTLATSVRERTREYGTLRAIGFRPHHVAGSIVSEAAAIGLIGALVGIGLAIPLINSGLGAFMEQNFTLFFPSFIVTPNDAVFAVFAAVALSGLAAVLPAYFASVENVTHALRHVA